MKTTKKVMAIAMLLIVLAASSCKQAQQLPLIVTNKSEYNLSDAALNKLKGELLVTIKNPNPYDIRIRKAELGVSVNNIKMGKAKTEKHLLIPANSEVEEVLYLESDFSDVNFFDIPKVLKTIKSKNLTITIKGNLKSGFFANKLNSPVKLIDTANIAEKTKPVIAFATMLGEKSKTIIKKIKNTDKKEN